MTATMPLSRTCCGDLAAFDPGCVMRKIHSALMFAALMIGHHFSISALTSPTGMKSVAAWYGNFL
jgi:hypothetical protein